MEYRLQITKDNTQQLNTIHPLIKYFIPVTNPKEVNKLYVQRWNKSSETEI